MKRPGSKKNRDGKVLPGSDAVAHQCKIVHEYMDRSGGGLPAALAGAQ
jgi:hypothetical protein